MEKEQQEITPSIAFESVKNVVAMYKGTLEEHSFLQQALKVIKDSINTGGNSGKIQKTD